MTRSFCWKRLNKLHFRKDKTHPLSLFHLKETEQPEKKDEEKKELWVLTKRKQTQEDGKSDGF